MAGRWVVPRLPHSRGGVGREGARARAPRRPMGERSGHIYTTKTHPRAGCTQATHPFIAATLGKQEAVREVKDDAADA
eukprot:scaffold165479_cov35-Tisochrysis_lutea.AAC.3